MPKQTDSPKISVIIPALNEEKLLPACIQSLKKQNFDQPYEIIVVDNNSDDRTAEIASSTGIKTVFEPHRGITWARQRGLEAARGEIIACVDADTIVAKDWLQKIYEALSKEDGVIAVSGKILYAKSNNWKGRLPRYWVSAARYGDRAIRFLLRKPGSLWGGNFAVRKDALIRAGGFNKNIKFFGEDTELSLRLGKVGKIKFNGKQLAYTSPRRFESQPLLRSVWYYVSNFVSLLIFNRAFDDRKNQALFPFKIPFRKILYASSLLFVMSALIFFAYDPTSQFYGRVYSAGLIRREKVVALSFDDGPNEPYTSEVLKILDENSVKATFFVTGKNAEYYPGTVKEIVRRGHVIANHSYSHSYRLPFETSRKIQQDVTKTENIICGLTGLRTGLFRPPHGLRTPWFLKAVKGLNYNIITWSDMTDDYDPDDSPQEISKDIIKNARPGGIIDLHDGKNLNHGIDRSNMVKALPMIIGQLKKEGYSFVTLPDLLQINSYK